MPDRSQPDAARPMGLLIVLLAVATSSTLLLDGWPRYVLGGIALVAMLVCVGLLASGFGETDRA